MLFTLLFSGIFVLLWSICGLIPWLVTSVISRGSAGLALLPLCIFTANVAAIAVPVLGADGMGGFIASFPVAIAASTALILVRKFALGSVAHHVPAANKAEAPPAGSEKT